MASITLNRPDIDYSIIPYRGANDWELYSNGYLPLPVGDTPELLALYEAQGFYLDVRTPIAAADITDMCGVLLGMVSVKNVRHRRDIVLVCVAWSPDLEAATRSLDEWPDQFDVRDFAETRRLFYFLTPWGRTQVSLTEKSIASHSAGAYPSKLADDIGRDYLMQFPVEILASSWKDHVELLVKKVAAPLFKYMHRAITTKSTELKYENVYSTNYYTIEMSANNADRSVSMSIGGFEKVLATDDLYVATDREGKKRELIERVKTAAAVAAEAVLVWKTLMGVFTAILDNTTDETRVSEYLLAVVARKSRTRYPSVSDLILDQINADYSDRISGSEDFDDHGLTILKFRANGW